VVAVNSSAVNFWTSIFPVLPQVLVYDVLAPLPVSFGYNLGLFS
jgi:hypothetical protein